MSHLTKDELFDMLLEKDIQVLGTETRNELLEKLGFATKPRLVRIKHDPIEGEDLKMMEKGKYIIVSGNTQNYRESLQQLGATWNTFYKTWSVPKSESNWSTLKDLVTSVTKPVPITGLGFVKTGKEIEIDKWGEDEIKITGDTYDLKEKFIQLGGRWDRKEKAWILPAETRRELEIDFVEPEIKKEEMVVNGKERNISISSYMGRAVVTGDTKGIEHLMRGLGGKWNVEYYGWVFPLSKKRELEVYFGL